MIFSTSLSFFLPLFLISPYPYPILLRLMDEQEGTLFEMPAFTRDESLPRIRLFYLAQALKKV